MSKLSVSLKMFVEYSDVVFYIFVLHQVPDRVRVTTSVWIKFLMHHTLVHLEGYLRIYPVSA